MLVLNHIAPVGGAITPQRFVRHPDANPWSAVVLEHLDDLRPDGWLPQRDPEEHTLPPIVRVIANPTATYAVNLVVLIGREQQVARP
jgi:hypothetical protein